MDDEELLRRLGKVAADQAHDGERSPWERLARGELSDDELDALERAALESADGEELLAAARPIDARAQERTVDALASHLAAARPIDARAQERTVDALATHLAPARPPARWRARVVVAAGGLALAASVALLFLARSTEPLPVYALHASGAASSRGPAPAGASADDAPCVLHASASGSFELVARPDDAVQGSLDARAFVVRGGEVHAWEGALAISPQGSVRILDENRKLAGAEALRLVVGRPQQLAPERALALARGAGGPGGRSCAAP